MINIYRGHYIAPRRYKLECVEIYFKGKSNGDLFSCEDNMLFSSVKISCFSAKAHQVFHWCLYSN